MRGVKPAISTDPDALDSLPVPDWFAPDASAEWSRIMPILLERRILTDADLGSLESYCVATGTIREMERLLQADGHILNVEGTLKKHPAVSVQSDAMTRARLLASELGLTPVSRSRPSVRDDGDDDDELIT